MQHRLCVSPDAMLISLARHTNHCQERCFSLPRLFMLKSHNCGELRPTHIDQEVTLAGWVNRRRDQGGLIFIDLRDRWGITQATINAQTAPEAHDAASTVGREYVIQVRGIVRARPEGMVNKDLATGEIELEVTAIKVLNPAKTTP